MIRYLSLKCRCCDGEVKDPLYWRPGDPCGSCGTRSRWQVTSQNILVTANSKNRLSADNALLQVWYALAGHTDPRHTPLETLNRLVRKHFKVRFTEEIIKPAKFRKDGISALLEWWSTRRLDSLWRMHDRISPGEGDPTVIDQPVVVVRIGSHDCLIDGNTRINLRMTNDVPEPHPVYLLHHSMPEGND